jgi:hypothetical protein
MREADAYKRSFVIADHPGLTSSHCADWIWVSTRFSSKSKKFQTGRFYFAFGKLACCKRFAFH